MRKSNFYHLKFSLLAKNIIIDNSN